MLKTKYSFINKFYFRLAIYLIEYINQYPNLIKFKWVIILCNSIDYHIIYIIK